MTAVDHTELVQLAEKHFTSESLNEDERTPVRMPCRFTGSEVSLLHAHSRFLARDVIYTSRAYATMSLSVCLSVCD